MSMAEHEYHGFRITDEYDYRTGDILLTATKGDMRLTTVLVMQRLPVLPVRAGNWPREVLMKHKKLVAETCQENERRRREAVRLLVEAADREEHGAGEET